MKLERIKNVIEYEGRDLQITDVSDATQPGSCGEPEYAYECIDRHGNVEIVMDWELARYRYRRNLEQMI
jgi:hypothetical protein